MDLNERPLHQLIDSLHRHDIRREQVVDDLQEAIREQNGTINAYLSLADRDDLVAQASAAGDRELSGLPIAVKDLISTRDFPTTCGSRFLETFRPIFDATAVERLREAGATLLGKTNLDEFGMGSSNENSAFGPVRNPLDTERVPGGSSGGSAAAVAAGMAPAALGTDTGGSIRLPASFCGVVGLKPSYGLVSRYGLIAYASSLDQIGPIAHTVRDVAQVLSIIAGPDNRDATSIDNGNVDYTDALSSDIDGLRVGVVRSFVAQLDAVGQSRVDEWIRSFEAQGAQVADVELPHAEHALPAYYLISAAEASANLARYDGVRYGQRASDGALEAMLADSRQAGFGPEVKRRIMLGTYALSAGYYDQWYGKAQQVRTLIRRDFQSAFADVDVLLMPTSPVAPFKLEERTADPLQMYLIDAFLAPVSLAGLCGISVPGGTVEGMPFGMQIVGPQLGEPRILQAAYAYEQRSA
ncbi:MAG: Asp-tRNA(Asn)/Glu-tRNA(Gln) amidotransferase subunit GatA [Candidatus Bipolaricaulia bacterium]